MKKQANGMWREKATYKGVTYDLCAKDPEALRKKIYDRKAAIDAGQYSISANMTVENWARVWLEEYKRPNIIENSYRHYKIILDLHILPYIGKKKVRDVLPVDIQGVLNRQQGRSKSQIRWVRQTLTGVFGAAVNNKLRSDNPCAGLVNPDGVEGGSRAFTDDELKLLFDACEDHPRGIIPLVVYYCGLRPGEVAALEPKRDIDLENKIIRVNSAVESGMSKRIKGPKTASGKRIVPIPDEFIPRLTEAVKKSNKYLVSMRNGDVMSGVYISKAWRTILQRMDIAAGADVEKRSIVKSVIGEVVKLPNGKKRIVYNLKLYWLRHTYCTNLQRAGVPINIAKDLMGHADTKMVERIYTHFTEDQFEATRKKLNAWSAAKNSESVSNSVSEQMCK